MFRSLRVRSFCSSLLLRLRLLDHSLNVSLPAFYSGSYCRALLMLARLDFTPFIAFTRLRSLSFNCCFSRSVFFFCSSSAFCFCAFAMSSWAFAISSYAFAAASRIFSSFSFSKRSIWAFTLFVVAVSFTYACFKSSCASMPSSE